MDADRTALVLTGGQPVDRDVLGSLPRQALVIAADSGIEQAATLGLPVHLAVGDFDSVTPAALQAAMTAGARVERHPVSKDRTDLEIALEAAGRAGARRVVIVGGEGGRLDHFLANALLVASPEFADLEIEWRAGAARVVVVRRRAEISGRPGDLLTLLAVGGAARRVRTEGLRYPLQDEDLLPGSSRGVSNELTGPLAAVSLESGTLLAVLPGGETDQRRSTG
ncbi:MAG: thiamine diphosphokinase [Acidimicrobiia bacterium]